MKLILIHIATTILLSTSSLALPTSPNTHEEITQFSEHDFVEHDHVFSSSDLEELDSEEDKEDNSRLKAIVGLGTVAAFAGGAYWALHRYKHKNTPVVAGPIPSSSSVETNNTHAQEHDSNSNIGSKEPRSLSNTYMSDDFPNLQPKLNSEFAQYVPQQTGSLASRQAVVVPSQQYTNPPPPMTNRQPIAMPVYQGPAIPQQPAMVEYPVNHPINQPAVYAYQPQPQQDVFYQNPGVLYPQLRIYANSEDNKMEVEGMSLQRQNALPNPLQVADVVRENVPQHVEMEQHAREMEQGLLVEHGQDDPMELEKKISRQSSVGSTTDSIA